MLANANPNKYNVYIKQGIDPNNEHCESTQSGFKFGIFCNNESSAYPSCGIGNVRGSNCVYLSFGLMHHYDSVTKLENWICTISAGIVMSPQAILVCAHSFFVNNVQYNAGVYILSAPYKVYELNEIIPDTDITVTKIG